MSKSELSPKQKKIMLEVRYYTEFACQDDLIPHLQEVLQGEYEIPLFGPQRILDVGANCGAFSLWAQRRFSCLTASVIVL